jgi:hypothetical protein
LALRKVKKELTSFEGANRQKPMLLERGDDASESDRGQDLSSILDRSQRGDLTVLVAEIAESMPRSLSEALDCLDSKNPPLFSFKFLNIGAEEGEKGATGGVSGPDTRQVLSGAMTTSPLSNNIGFCLFALLHGIFKPPGYSNAVEY